jgi:hypothetical protein
VTIDGDASDVDAIVAMGLHFQATTKYAMHLHATEARADARDGSARIPIGDLGGGVERGLGDARGALYVQPMSGRAGRHGICLVDGPDGTRRAARRCGGFAPRSSGRRTKARRCFR